MRQLFEKADVDKNGMISFEEFQSELENPQMKSYLKAIDLDQDEAEELFHLLDIEDLGTIDAEELVCGCMRLHGTAKAIDLAAFMHEYRQLSLMWQEHARLVQQYLESIAEHLLKNGHADRVT